MKLTIITATVTIGNKEVELSKAIVRQLAYLGNWNIDQVRIVGSVDLGDEIRYLYQTPDGLQSAKSLHTQVSKLNDKVQRIVLTK